MDATVKIGSILGLGFLANLGETGVFSPVVQLGALGLLAVLLVMNYKTARDDRAERGRVGDQEREIRSKQEAARTEREKLRLDSIQSMHKEMIAALERAYNGREK